MRPERPARALLILAPILAIAAFPGLAVAEPEEVPLPVAKSSLLKDQDVVYVVEGEQTIPPGVEITLQKGVRLRGKGAATLVVEGQFVAHGISGTEVSIAGLRIVPAPDVQQLHVDMCDFSGGGVMTEEEQSTGGMITIENCDFSGATIDLSTHAGKIKVMSVRCGPLLRIRGVDLPDKKNKSDVDVRTNALRGGVEIQGVADVTVRGNTIGGGAATFKDNAQLTFDANRIESGSLVFEHSEGGSFKKTKIDKCDIFASVIRVYAPASGKKETVVIEKCYFSGVLDEAKLEEIVQDREDDETNAVKVLIRKPSKRVLGLAKEWNN